MADLTTDIRETVARRPRDGARALRRRRARGPRRAGALVLRVRAADEAGVFGSGLYDDGETDGATAGALGASLGCGVPTAVADLHEGETVLDLGSGAGADVLISARRVGAAGKAIGLDMTDEMLELARANAAEAGVANVEFVKGYLEDIPLAGRVGRRGDLQLRDQPRRRQAAGARRGRARAAARAGASRSPT